MIGFLSILAVGFFLGMRHATDPDHVIAVTTIVSNQRNRAQAALIGAFWGVGHTVTIFAVGTAIILFNLVIPVRVGLSMELSVAVMLIILGLMNVSGFLRSIPSGPVLTPAGDNVDTVVHSHSHRVSLELNPDQYSCAVRRDELPDEASHRPPNAVASGSARERR